jgi:Mg/Co/Ni transporter MgtE
MIELKETSSRVNLSFNRSRLDRISPDILVKSFWVSTALGLILSLPPLGLFIAVFHGSGNILVGAIIGFGLHFILLSTSEKISSSLTSLFED